MWQASPVSWVLRTLFIPYKHHASSHSSPHHGVGLCKTPRESVPADITLPIGPNPGKQQEAARSPPEVLCRIPSYDITPSGAQKCNVSGTSACMSSVKTREAEQSKPRLELPVLVGSGSYVYSSIKWSFTCLISKTSFRLCPPQENTPSHVCPSKTLSDTTDFPKKSRVCTSLKLRPNAV